VTTVKRSLDEIDTSDIDWTKVDATTEEEIARQIAEDADTAPDMAGRLAEARLVRPPAAVDVRAIRTRLGLSQAAFARRYGFNQRAVQDWEQGRRRPEGSARLLLTLIDREPKLVDRILAEAGVG
jgi:putative transcriptional regulator